MITQIHSTPIVVSDQDRALAFYVGALGWEKTIDNDMGNGMRFITVRPPQGGAMLALGQPEMFDRPAPGDEPVHTGISLIARDLRATFEELRTKGATITEEPQEMPWGGLGGHFADPDGNIFFVAEEDGA